VLLGGHVFAQPEAALLPWALAAVGTGLALFATDLHASCAILFELRGAVVLLKLLLTALVAALPEYAVPLLGAVLMIGAWSSHMPGYLRHRLWLLDERVQPDRRRG